MKIPMNIHTKIAGRYKFKVLKADRSVKLETDWSDNLITDNGLDFIGTNPSFMWHYCSVGSGTTAPANSDTQLETFVASTDTHPSGSSSGNVGSPDYYAFVVETFEFGAGVAEGNLSEVGVGRANDGTDLQSRALIVDGGGSPTTITVLGDEILQVTFERRHYMPQTDVVSSFDLSGTTYNYTLRAAGVLSALTWTASLTSSAMTGATGSNRGATVFDGPMGATIEDHPSGNADDRTSVSTDAYVAGSHERTGTAVFGLSEGNFATGIKSFRFGWQMLSTYQAEFDTAIPKDGTQVLELNVKHSWGRH